MITECSKIDYEIIPMTVNVAIKNVAKMNMGVDESYATTLYVRC